MMNRHPSRAGFTLVELAMAAFLLTVGVLTVFAILRLGVQSRAETEEATRLALFADSFITSIRIAADKAAAETTDSDDAWTRFWEDLQEGTNLPLPGLVMDEQYFPSHGTPDDSSTNMPVFFADGEPHTLLFRHLAEKPSDLVSALESDARISYECTFDHSNSSENSTTIGSVLSLSLNAWINDRARATTFFTIFNQNTPMP